MAAFAGRPPEPSLRGRAPPGPNHSLQTRQNVR